MAPDLGLIRAVSRENLAQALRLKRGKKILIIDSKLTATLDLIANFKFLQDQCVEKVYHLEKCGPPQPLESGVNQCLYLIRADLISARLVCDQINSNLNRHVDMSYGVILVPRCLHAVMTLFESEGIYEHVSINQYSYELIPLEDHLFSLEFPDVIKDLWISQDTSYLAAIAKALFNLRGIYGDFSHVVGVGNYAQNILKMTAEFERFWTTKAHHRVESDIPTLILVDRDIDWISPLMTSLSYEAILDEIFGIKGRMVCFDSSVTKKEPIKHNVTTDRIFEKARYLHISKVVDFLMSKAKEIKLANEGSAGLNLQQVKKFVAQDLQKLQTLKKMLVLNFDAMDAFCKDKTGNLKKWVDLETNIVGNSDQKETWAALEDAMARSMDPTRVLRLFCLATLAMDGLKDSKSLKTQFVQSYGYKHLVSLQNLEKMGILYAYKGLDVGVKGLGQVVTKVTSGAVNPGSEKGKPVNPQTILKKLGTSSNNPVDISEMNHPSYIFNGKLSPFVAYLVAKVLDVLVTPKINAALAEKKIEDVLRSFNISDKLTSVKFRSTSEAFARGRTCLVFVVGGITRGEVAACQVIGRNLGFNILCGGTDIINGNKIVNSAMNL